MLFYFVRHGQTEANRLEMMAGSGLDYPLTEEGHRQAEKLAQVIGDHIDHPLHRLVASNMQRARQTAEYLASRLNLPLELDAEFREWHLGEWEGRPFSECAHLFLNEGEPRYGESRQTFYARVKKAWDSVHSDTHPYLIVAHGGVWLAMQDLLNMPRFKINNCNLIKVESSDSKWTARILG